MVNLELVNWNTLLDSLIQISNKIEKIIAPGFSTPPQPSFVYM